MWHQQGNFPLPIIIPTWCGWNRSVGWRIVNQLSAILIQQNYGCIFFITSWSNKVKLIWLFYAEETLSWKKLKFSLGKIKCLVLIKLFCTVLKHMQNHMHLMIHHLMTFIHMINNLINLLRMVEWCVGGKVRSLQLLMKFLYLHLGPLECTLSALQGILGGHQILCELANLFFLL